MNANDSPDRQKSDHPEILEKELSGEIVGGFYDVYNTHGFGFLEGIYSKSLEIALCRRGLLVEREVACEIYFCGERVGVHRADIIVERRIIVEVKAAQVLANFSKRQLMNYLRALISSLGFCSISDRSHPSIASSAQGSQESSGAIRAFSSDS